MAHPKFTLYKHIKVDGKWRYARAAVASNNKQSQAAHGRQARLNWTTGDDNVLKLTVIVS